MDEPGRQLPPTLTGFAGIGRYWDRSFARPAAKILPGEYYVTVADELITTVLGSCVSACIRDRVLGIGGMNHFMLPISSAQGWGGRRDLLSTAARYGNYAMEHMINDILKAGGHRRSLEAKVFGGASIIQGLGNVGEQNIAFVRDYLDTEGVPLVNEDVGDVHPRKVAFFPATGRALVKRLRTLHNDTLVSREQAYRDEIVRQPVAGEVELF